MALIHLILFLLIGGLFLLLFMKKMKVLRIILIPLIIVTAWQVYDSPISLKKFKEEFTYRQSAVIQNLKDIRTAQIAYKDKYRVYSNNFDSLLNFVNNDSIALIKAIGEVPDSLTEPEALSAGIITRDSIFVLVKDNVFNLEYLNTRDKRFPFDLEKLQIVPFSENKRFSITSGDIEKGKVIVQVFEVSTMYQTFLKGIDANNKGVELSNVIKVGSMTEASIIGNWGE